MSQGAMQLSLYLMRLEGEKEQAVGEKEERLERGLILESSQIV